MTAPPATPGVFNHFTVPLRMWRKWNDLQRAAFNRLYSHINANQALFSHPKARPLPDAHWNTVAWNTAWIAAEAIDGHFISPHAVFLDTNADGFVVRRTEPRA